MPARVVVVCSAPEPPEAARVLDALRAARIPAALADGDPRPQLDACELALALLDGAASRSPRVQQTIGYALARGVRVVAAGRRTRDVGFVTDRAPWPAGERSLRRLVALVQAALPATPKAAARSLALSSDARWGRAIGAEAAAELAARGWGAVPMARTGAFVGGMDEPVWRKRVGRERVLLRLRVAPFNPVDLLHVRARSAASAFEWWVLRDSRPDAWMKRVFGGAPDKLTARTKLFTSRVAATGGNVLVARRILTQRVDRTGALADELRAFEAWLATPRTRATPARTPGGLVVQ